MVPLQRALKADPASPEIRAHFGNLLSYIGVPEKGIPIMAQCLKFIEWPEVIIARSFLQAGDYSSARVWAGRVIQRRPDYTWTRMIRASALGHQDRPDEAWAELEECERRQPGRVNHEFMTPPTQYKNPHDHIHILDGLRKAGWQP